MNNGILMPRLKSRFSVRFEKNDSVVQIAEQVSRQLTSIELPVVLKATPTEANAFDLKTDMYSVYVQVDDDSFGAITKSIYTELMQNSFKVVVCYFTGTAEISETVTFSNCKVASIQQDVLSYADQESERYQLQAPDYLVGEQPELQKALKGIQIVKQTFGRPITKMLKINFSSAQHWINPAMELLMKKDSE